MATAKIFQHGGSQAVRLPKAFRFEGAEVQIEKRGEEVILKPTGGHKFKTLREVARYMRDNFPQGADFPDLNRPKRQQSRDLNLG